MRALNENPEGTLPQPLVLHQPTSSGAFEQANDEDEHNGSNGGNDDAPY
jgi:hypothetical protein